MTDLPQFPPPVPAPVTSSPQFPPPVPMTQLAATPVYTPPLQAPRRSYKGLIIAGSVFGGLLLVGGAAAIGIAVATAVQTVQEATAPAPQQLPLIVGDAGSPLAVHPTECPDACFTGSHVSGTILDDDELAKLGLTTETSAWGDFPDSTVQAEYSYTAGAWAQGESSPDECFVTYFQAPIAVPYDSRPELNSDSIYFLASHSDANGWNSTGQTTRLFDTSQAASDHMAAVADQIAACDHYDTGTGAEYWAADVSPEPALDLPDSVAAVGWAEVSGNTRYYVIDFRQRVVHAFQHHVFEGDALSVAE